MWNRLQAWRNSWAISRCFWKRKFFGDTRFVIGIGLLSFAIVVNSGSFFLAWLYNSSLLLKAHKF